MSIAFTSKVESWILHVLASGFVESTDDVQRYAAGVLERCLERVVLLVFCAETGIDWRLRDIRSV